MAEGGIAFTPKPRRNTNDSNSPEITIRSISSKTLSEEFLNNPLCDINYEELLSELYKVVKAKQRGDSAKVEKKFTEIKSYIEYLLLIQKSINDPTPNQEEGVDQEIIDLKERVTYLQLEREIRETKLNSIELEFQQKEENYRQKIEDLQQIISTSETYKNTEETIQKYHKLEQSHNFLIKELDKKTEEIELKTKEIATILELFDHYKKTRPQVVDNLTLTTAQGIPQAGSSLPAIPVSRKAIQLQKISEKTSIQEIKEALSTSPDQLFSGITCDTSRDKNSLILTTGTEEQLDQLAKELEANPKLTEKANIIVKGPKTRKLIILGVPREVTDQHLLDIIATSVHPSIDSYISVTKRIERKRSKISNIVVAVEERIADSLLHKGTILIKFNNCKIDGYRPIIRCNKCQYYGHIRTQCRQPTPTCQFCALQHDTSTCKYKNKPKAYRCINCYKKHDESDTPLDYYHPANSSNCYKYLSILYARRSAQQYFQLERQYPQYL